MPSKKTYINTLRFQKNMLKISLISYLQIVTVGFYVQFFTVIVEKKIDFIEKKDKPTNEKNKGIPIHVFFLLYC